MLTKTTKGYLWLSIGVLCIGTFSIPYQQAVQHAKEPVLAVFGLLCMAALFATPSLFKAKLFPKGKFRLHFFIFLMMALAGILGNAIYAYALLSISPAVGQVTQRSEILWVVFFSWLVFREPAGVGMWLGLLLIIVGIVVMQYQHLNFNWQDWKGLFFSVLSALCFAQIHVISKWMVQRISPLQMNAGRLIFSAIIMCLVPSMINLAWHASLEFWLWVSLAAFTGPFLGRLTFMSAILYLPLSRCMVISALGPILTVFLQYWLFQIETTWYQVLGGGIVIIGIIAGVALGYGKPNLNSKPGQS